MLSLLANPWTLLAIGVGLVLSHGVVYLEGRKSANADCLADKMLAIKVKEVIRGAIRVTGDKLSQDLETKLAGLKVENKTVNRYITREKEIHHVLTNPDCAYPVSTIRVLNGARRGNASGGPPASQPAGTVPAARPAR
jgi:hypothetical protein